MLIAMLKFENYLEPMRIQAGDKLHNKINIILKQSYAIFFWKLTW